jgi:hypothetical protein
MNTKTKIIIGVVIILVLLALIAAIRGWYTGLPKLLTTQWLTAPEIKEAAKIPKAKVPLKGIVTISKKEVSKKLKLPDDIAKDDNKQITATAEIPPYEGKTDVAAIMTIVDGEGKTEIIAKQQPLSFFGLENRGALGVRWGYSSRAANKTELDGYGSWNFLRIGATHTGFYGEVTSTGDIKAMVGLEFRWGAGAH